MSKERLEKIEDMWKQKSDEYNFLLEKARLAEEYSEIIDSQNESLKKLMDKNERYRKAIEFGIEYLKNSDIRRVQLVVTALKSALEESE